MQHKKYEILTEQSEIEWTGKKVTGAHNGTIEIRRGTLILEDDKLVGGEFVIDSTSIKILDVTDRSLNAQFAAHLASDDFFSSELYPEAYFRISSAEPDGINNYYINGNLTIRETTHPIVFPAVLYTNGNSLTADGKIIVDRTRYGMRFRSGNFFTGLGDHLIYNNFVLHVHISAIAVTEKVRLETVIDFE